MYTATGAAIGGTVGVVIKVGLYFIGFSSSGVVAGSAAADIQSDIGDVPAGSAFAWAQSIGTRVVGSPFVLVGAIGGLLAYYGCN